MQIRGVTSAFATSDRLTQRSKPAEPMAGTANRHDRPIATYPTASKSQNNEWGVCSRTRMAATAAAKPLLGQRVNPTLVNYCARIQAACKAPEHADWL